MQESVLNIASEALDELIEKINNETDIQELDYSIKSDLKNCRDDSIYIRLKKFPKEK